MRHAILIASLAALVLVPAALAKAPKTNTCSAFSVEWPGAGTDWVSITGCKVGASLTVVQQGKLKFNILSLENDEGGVYFEKMGKVRYNKKKKRAELTFTAIEQAPEYEAKAKAVLYFDGRSWKVGCDQKVCEILQ